MSDAPPEDVAEDAATAAPTYGQNGRDLILQAARLLEANAPAAQSAAQAPKQQPAAPQRPDFSDDAYYAVVPCASRPSITYDPRAKIPRKNRQAALNRLVAQHLRLATQGALREKKLAYLGQQEVWFAAIKDAVAQEAALYKRAGSKQVYQNMLARAKAGDHAPASPTAGTSADLRSGNVAAAMPAQTSGPAAEPGPGAAAEASPGAAAAADGAGDDGWQFGAAAGAAAAAAPGDDKQAGQPAPQVPPAKEPQEQEHAGAAGVKRKHADLEPSEPPKTQ